MVLNYEENINTTLSQLDDEIRTLNKNLQSLESELSVSKTVNSLLEKRIVDLERQCWKNKQDSRRECLEIVGMPENTSQDKVCEIFDKIGAKLSPENLEACHPIKSCDKNKIIVKFSRRKDCQLVLENKRKLKSLSTDDTGLPNLVFINESLCSYYKIIWSKCKKLWRDKKNFLSLDK